jgi:hypothetical protein
MSDAALEGGEMIATLPLEEPLREGRLEGGGGDRGLLPVMLVIGSTSVYVSIRTLHKPPQALEGGLLYINTWQYMHTHTGSRELGRDQAACKKLCPYMVIIDRELPARS